MNMINEALQEIVEKSQAKMRDGDVIGDDGLIRCGKCGMPRQMVIQNAPWGITVVGVMCACDQKEYEWEEARRIRLDAIHRAEAMREEGIQDRTLRTIRFEDAVMDENLRKAKKYAENWDEMRKSGTGLLLMGGTGTGKTFAAACIVNALIEQGVTCLMTSFPRILNSGYDKETLIQDMARYGLVVIDDLGAERQSEYALETVYLAVDERYKSGKPMIITTNLSEAEMRKPEDIACKRIYERILERCLPIRYDGENRRASRRKDTLAAARALLE